jgi:copper transport protein
MRPVAYLSRAAWAVLVGALATVAAMAWHSAPAVAHGLLAASTPADGESVQEPPAEVVLTFTEAPDIALTTVRVHDGTGSRVDAARVAPVAGQPLSVRVPLPRLAVGTYTVAWRTTTSSDGHTTAGTVAFGVGVPAPERGIAAGQGPATPAPTGAGTVGRWLLYVGVVVLLGAAVVGVAVAARPQATARWALLWAWAAAAAGTVLSIADQRANARTSLSTLLASSTGQRLTTQAIAVGLAGTAVAWAWRRPGRASLLAVGAGASAVMLARALAGHAGASDPRWLAVGLQWIHLVSVGAWVGGLPWLLLAMGRGDPGRGRGLAWRFASVAGWTLVVVAVSGAGRALDEVGAWDRLLDTDFGVALVVKLGLVAALVAAGAAGRFRLVPAGRVARLRRLVRGEVALGAAVLAATAVLAGLPPSALVAAASRSRPLATGAIIVSGTDAASTVRVQLVLSPGLPGPNRFDATVADHTSGQPLPAQGVALRFQSLERPDAGAATLDLAPGSDGHWRGSGRGVSFPGRWTITMVVAPHAAEAVEVPLEIETRQPATGSEPAPGAGDGCGTGQPDPAYSVTVDSDPDPPRLEGTAFRITVRRDGRPVTGAKVCLTADMPDMQHPGVSRLAKEAQGGRYNVELKFEMAGAWAASVVITEPGRPVALVPMRFLVR